MIYEAETRVGFKDPRRGSINGKIIKHVPAQGSFAEVYVIDWDDGTRSTEWAENIRTTDDEAI